MNLPSIEDPKRYTSPRLLNNGKDDDFLAAYEQGFEDRVCCHDRQINPYRHDSDRSDYFKGWDNADKVAQELVR